MPRVARWFNFKPNSDKFLRALDWKRLIYFMTIWKILWTFGVFYDNLVHLVFSWYILSCLGIMYKEKSGIPACYLAIALETYRATNTLF
jgi:hypothetical protein